MRIIFAGTPEIAVPTLRLLIEKKHQVVSVVTKPDIPQGRGKKIIFNPVKRAALELGIPVYQPSTLKTPAAFQYLRTLSANVLVNVACGFLIPEDILTLPAKGCINLHPSLLPRWRGAAPLQRALLAGDLETGISIMQMDAGWDTGDLWKQVRFPILPEDTSASLLSKAGILGSKLIVEVLEQLDQLTLKKQTGEACYADKLTKEEGKITWNQSVTLIDRKIRAMNPWPVAFTSFRGKILRIWEAKVTKEKLVSEPGVFQWLKNSLKVGTSDFNLELLKVQPEGGKIITAEAWLNGINHRKTIGQFDAN